MRHQGRITNWKDDQGFGFITPDGDGKQVFVHIKSFLNGKRRPIGNEVVTYELDTDARARMRAQRVAFVGESKPLDTSSGRGIIPIALAAAFLVFLGASAFAGKLPLVVFCGYMAASVIAFLAYALDKSAARNDRWRIQESTLHLFALSGGWPGALIAQKMLRHKSSKTSFQIEFWIIVVLNCSAFGWLFSSSGAGARRDVAGAWSVISPAIHRILKAIQ